MVEIKKMFNNLFLMDKFLGYKFGFFLWNSFWIPSFSILMLDDTLGACRDYLYTTTLFSTVTLLYYCYHQWTLQKNPIIPSSVILIELYARFTALSYYGYHNVVTSDHSIGIWNGITFFVMLAFSIQKLVTCILVNFNYKEFKEYLKSIDS